jgi:hypothetical protein
VWAAVLQVTTERIYRLVAHGPQDLCAMNVRRDVVVFELTLRPAYVRLLGEIDR